MRNTPAIEDINIKEWNKKLEKNTLLVTLVLITVMTLSSKIVCAQGPIDPSLWVKIGEDPYQDGQPPKDAAADIYFNQYYYGDGTYIHFRMDVAAPSVPERTYSIFFDTTDGGDTDHDGADYCFQLESGPQGVQYVLYHYEAGNWVAIKLIEGNLYTTQPPDDDGDGTNPPPQGWLYQKALISDLGDITKSTVVVRYETRDSPSFQSNVVDTHIMYIPRDSISEIPILALIPFSLMTIFVIREVKRRNTIF